MPTNRKRLKRERKIKLSENYINYFLTGKYDHDASDGFDIFLLENNISEMKKIFEDNKELLLEIWNKKYKGIGEPYIVKELERMKNVF
jgi:hypothetical protein